MQRLRAWCGHRAGPRPLAAAAANRAFCAAAPAAPVPLASVGGVPNVLPHFPEVRWAMAYGSAAFAQHGQSQASAHSMVDYVFAVEDPRAWHAENLERNPAHYSWLARTAGAGWVASLGDTDAGVYYNTLVESVVPARRIKYGVVGAQRLVDDLRNWSHLYLAGRLHKPVLRLREDAEIDDAAAANVAHAARAALLLLPPRFREDELFVEIAGLSYGGDWRMLMGGLGERPSKVSDIVHGRSEEWRSRYKDALGELVARGALSVESSLDGSRTMVQDTSAEARSLLLQALPAAVLQDVVAAVNAKPVADWTPAEVVAKASHERVGALLRESIGKVVRRSSLGQTVKAVLTTTVGKTVLYVLQKIRNARN